MLQPHPSPRRPGLPNLARVLILTALVVASVAVPSAAQGQLALFSGLSPRSAPLAPVLPKLFIPLAANNARVVTGPGPTGALWLPFDISNNQFPVVPTVGSNVEVDGNGGIHVTYSVADGFATDAGTIPLFYAYCPSGCSSSANWTKVELGDRVLDARLQLTPDGHPRVLLYTTINKNPNLNALDFVQYLYATCNANCTSPTSWTMTPVSQQVQDIPARRSSYLHSYFRLDSLGNPSFVYSDSQENLTHNGMFFRTCFSNCTNPLSWAEVLLDPSGGFPVSLALSPTGQPRLMYTFLNFVTNTSVVNYAQCNTNCLTHSNWSAKTLFDSGVNSTSARYNLQTDSNGNPRAILFSGDMTNPSFTSSTLYYLSCDLTCTGSSTTWTTQAISALMSLPAGYGATPQLRIDSADLPHLTFAAAGNGVAYGWCTTSCQSPTGNWKYEMVESASSLAGNYPVVPFYNCTISTWSSGGRSSLAFDPLGNVRISFDARHDLGGQNANNPTLPCPVTETDIQLPRLDLVNPPVLPPPSTRRHGGAGR